MLLNSTFKLIKRTSTYLLVILLLFVLLRCKSNEPAKTTEWPEVTTQSKPWTRWWWMGNILDEANITLQLEEFAKAGLGGVEITPIYGVYGYEDQFIDYLSPEWLKMLDHTLSEADRLALKVDMVMGTGWPYGGPQVEPEFAASKLVIQKYKLKANETFTDEIRIDDKKQIGLAELQKVIAINDSGEKMDLTPLLENNKITYIPASKTSIYAIFCAKTRQQVKRAAPGGAGYVLDHFSKQAFNDYTIPFDKTLTPFENKLRGIFNDSYEVYNADFSPQFLDEFKTRRKYDLLGYIPLIYEKPNTPEYKRLLCDYRETIAELLLEDFAQPWNKWCNEHTFITKFQAHGSPGNLIDLYAAANIPECEVFGSPKFDIPGYRRDTTEVRVGDSNKMMFKFCSSAAHLKGDEIVSSETFTWLREHFKTALSHCKPVADDLMLSGVNHIFLHGSTYTIQEEEWPGWKFYASVNFNPTNTIWKDAPYLFEYISRCQSILQKAKTDNEVLVYWPIHDAYTQTDIKHLIHQFKVHSVDEWLLPTSFYKTAVELDSLGFGFDFLSDQFLLNSEFQNNQIKISENASYETIVVPDMESIPLNTLKKLIELKVKGADIEFLGKPETVPGLYKRESQELELKKISEKYASFFTSNLSLETRLNEIGVYGEKAYSFGLQILRKEIDGNKIYFIANQSSETIDEYIPFNAIGESVLIMDPMTSKTGLADFQKTKSGTNVRIQIEPGQSLFIKVNGKIAKVQNWKYLSKSEKPLVLTQPWEINFLEGGPTIPESVVVPVLESWTKLGNEYENFSGTAKYATTFSISKTENTAYMLKLGELRESARVFLNGQFVGAVFAHPFKIDLSEYLIEGENELNIEVTNLAANRLRALEKSGKEWKKFHEINMVNIHYEKFDATKWIPSESGLLGEVKIVPYSVN